MIDSLAAVSFFLLRDAMQERFILLSDVCPAVCYRRILCGMAASITMQ